MSNEKRYTKTLGFRPSRDVERRIAKLLKRDGIKPSDLIRRAVEAYLPTLEAK